MLRLIYILVLFLSLNLFGVGQQESVEMQNTDDISVSVADQMRNYCELVCDNWAGISAGYFVKNKTQQVPVNVYKHIPVDWKNRNKTICREFSPNYNHSGESGVCCVRADKGYYVFALRCIII